jgi:hypothetical protein
MKIWKRFLGVRRGKLLVFLALIAFSLGTGCAQQDPYLYTGAGLGGALGAGLGAAINNHNPWKGAAIGGLLGVAGGGLAGAAYGQSKTAYPPQGYYPPAQQQGYYSSPQQQGYYSSQPDSYYQ